MNFEKDTKLYGIGSAILGGLAMIGWLIPTVGMVLSALAIITGNIGISNEEDGWPLAGVTLGVASLILVVIRSGLVYLYG